MISLERKSCISASEIAPAGTKGPSLKTVIGGLHKERKIISEGKRMEGYKETTLFTTPEATVGIQEYHFDENSTETYPLRMRGVYVGELSWGLFSRYYYALEKNGKIFGDIGCHACGIIRKEKGVALETDEDVRNYEAELNKSGTSILEQIVKYMENYITITNQIVSKLGFDIKDYNDNDYEEAHEQDNVPNPFNKLSPEELLFIRENNRFWSK